MRRSLGPSSLKLFYAAFVGASPQTNSFCSRSIRCMMTASFRPTAKEAFLRPFFLISLSPHALSLLHFWLLVRMTTPASVNKDLSSIDPHFEILPCFCVSPDE